MLVVFTDQIIQVHLPKSGGTWLRSVLVSDLGGKDFGGGHDPFWFIQGNPDIEGRMTIGTSRSPWDWYVSLWCHARRNGDEYTRQLGLWGNGSPEFKDVLYGWTHTEEVWEMPLSLGVVWAAAGRKMEDVVETDGGVGFCSWAHRYQYGLATASMKGGKPEWGVNCLLDTGSLHEAVTALLEHPVDEESHPMINTRKAMGAVNVGARGPYDHREWYDDEMVEWVSKADAELIALMGWPAPFEPARNPYVHLGAN